MVLAVKLLVAMVKIWIFFIKHDDDMLGDIAHGIIDGIPSAGDLFSGIGREYYEGEYSE